MKQVLKILFQLSVLFVVDAFLATQNFEQVLNYLSNGYPRIFIGVYSHKEWANGACVCAHVHVKRCSQTQPAVFISIMPCIIVYDL